VKGSGTPKNRDLLLSVIVLASAGSMAIVASLVAIPSSSCANNRGPIRAFTLLASPDGYNGTKDQGGPVFGVQTCDTVALTFVNRDTQVHGLSVDFYATKGLEATGGETLSIQFLAYKPGQFRAFCNVFCSIHSTMQHAQLNVGCMPGTC
jgi:hypothetical protein